MHPQQRARALAEELGFDVFGVAPLRAPRNAEHFRAWLRGGLHADLDYLARQVERICDPARTAPSGTSLLIVGWAHSRAEVELPRGGRIARYAAGRDYHNVMTRKLRKLRARLAAEGWIRPDALARPVVDAGPLLERSHAAEAGLGFPSKAANLLHPRFGPWFFLGELILDVEFEPTPELSSGSCGTCRACIDACPTGAIVADGVVDARKCISYHTIENRGPTPHELRRDLGTWVFGCDVCSEVCPWGRKAPDLGARLGTHRAVAELALERWVELRDPQQWKATFEGSPLQRARRAGLARNAALVLGNAPREGAEPVLLESMVSDPDAMVREAAAWALVRGYAARSAVQRALDGERDPLARAGIERTLCSEV